ncbi:hypothetical protein M422DRAFT_23041 [Sphaerobolus stellatus SS14]|nr:hypothetical protein M422DRAFT_23041 [Sphaerobolus stellatus SS14]
MPVVDIDEVTDLYLPPPVDDVPDTKEDQPIDGTLIPIVGAEHLPYLIFGAGTLANQYNDDTYLNTDGPLRTVRLALRYGMNAFDTSPYYGSSEVILGAILRSLSATYPRTSYKLTTKVGRYPINGSTFDYSPETIRASVLRSLSRLGTDHLDAVYLHDVEFVATPVPNGPNTGDPRKALEEPAPWGLTEGDEGKIHGEGDKQILAALQELFNLKAEGMIKAVGISGYPLPTLLRLALLALHNPPYHPLDILLSYSHYTLQNNAFEAYLPHFRNRAKISQLVTASPFSMGLLTANPPNWHPAPPDMMAAKNRALESNSDWNGGLPNLALGYSFREGEGEMKQVPRVVGLSNMKEVHETMRAWRQIVDNHDEERLEREAAVRRIFQEAGYEEYSWQSPKLS